MNNQNPFEGKAIKCDTLEQMMHLAEIAQSNGIQPFAFNTVHGFDSGHNYFMMCSSVLIKNSFSNYKKSDIESHETEIAYSDFIASLTPSVEQIIASDNC